LSPFSNYYGQKKVKKEESALLIETKYFFMFSPLPLMVCVIILFKIQNIEKSKKL